MRFSLNFSKRFLLIKISVIAFLATILFSCTSDERGLAESFQLAGNNRQEIKKTLEHFNAEKNSKKIRAAEFLLSQMKYQFHHEGTSKDRYDSLLNILSKVPYERMEKLEFIWDSLRKSIKTPIRDDAYLVCDLKNISSQNLIEHIDAAFEAWNKPWSKNISFGDFCEYILPYKLVNEQPDKWMVNIQKRYHYLAEKNSSQADPYQMCLAINNQLKKDFKIRSFPSIWDLNFHELDMLKSGKCYHATQYTTYVMRSLGIPIAMDFTPYWGNMNGGHEWNALIFNGHPVPFIGSESDPGLTKIDLARQRRRAKIFRRTYSFQQQSLAALTKDPLDIPALFRSAQLRDVTDQYIAVSDAVVDNLPSGQNGTPLYLCVFNRQEWVPTAWAMIKHGKSKFEKMGRDIIYLPMYYQSGELSAAGSPVLINSKGLSVQINDNGDKTKLVIKQKSPEGPGITKGQEYELLIWQGKWKPVEKRTASADSIVYNGVSKNALYRITSKDKMSKERIFIIDNCKPLWK